MIKLGKVSEETKGCGNSGLEFWVIPSRRDCM